jgi:hypothetical protein
MEVDPKELARLLLQARVIPDSRTAAMVIPTVEDQIDRYRFEMFYGGSVESVISAGDPFDSIGILISGSITPMTMPVSVLNPPFAFGLHEYLLSAENRSWISSYFKLEDSAVIWIPEECLDEVCRVAPVVRSRINELVLQRFARFCWTSLSVTSTPTDRTLSAILSRVALWGDLHQSTTELEFDARSVRRELMRLTTLSRTALFKVLNSEDFKKHVLMSETDDREELTVLNMSDLVTKVEDGFIKHQLNTGDDTPPGPHPTS